MNPVERFLNTYKSEKTKQNYGSHLKVYFEFLQTKPETYFTEKRDYANDLERWVTFNENKAPLTIAGRINCVRLLMEDNDITIPNKIWKQLKRKQKANKPITLDRIPTNEELKQILEHGSVKERALFLIASSSGMRIDEILQLEPDDIDLKSSPPKIYVRASTAKFGKARITFMSEEARQALIEWYKIRGKFLKGAISKCNREKNPITHKNPEDKTIFPFTYMTSANIWHRLLKDAELADKDKSTGFYRLHIHVLRKFFKTRLLNAGMQDAIVRKLMGQEDPLGSSYDRFTEDNLRDSYLNCMYALLVENTSDIRESLAKKDEQIKEMKMDLLELRLTIQEIKNGKK